MHKNSYYIVNAITVYRVVASLFLLFLIITGRVELFKWFLAISFFTDAIDGFLARRYEVVSALGSKLDSIGDDLTVFMAILGIVFLKPGFIIQQLSWVVVLLVLYLLQLFLALRKYGRMTNFHTYTAKVAAVLQGVFLILLFFMASLPSWLFYLAAVATMIDLLEEIALVFILNEWKADVKGIYWVWRKK